eukprot:scaffold179377_cov30-Tisochrysis_lutea.AAC.4
MALDLTVKRGSLPVLTVPVVWCVVRTVENNFRNLTHALLLCSATSTATLALATFPRSIPMSLHA